MGIGTGGVRGFRVRFRKAWTARYLSHRDLVRTLGRAVRRTGRRPALTKGFHPRPRMRIRPAVSLGVPALSLALDIFLQDDPSPNALAHELDAVLPPGLSVLNAAPLADMRASPMTRVVWRFKGPLPDSAEIPPLADLGFLADGSLLLSVRPVRGMDPPGARALASALAGDTDPGRLLQDAEMVLVEFLDEEDGEVQKPS